MEGTGGRMQREGAGPGPGSCSPRVSRLQAAAASPRLPSPPHLASPPPPPRPADRIAATLQLLTFFFISVFAFDPHDFCQSAVDNGYEYACGTDSEEWPDFFQLPVLMLMLITLLNDGTLISIGYDRVKASPRPGGGRGQPRAALDKPCSLAGGSRQSARVRAAALAFRPRLPPTRPPARRSHPPPGVACRAEKWNLRVLFLVSTVLGIVSMGSSLLLVALVLDSPNPGSLFQKMGLPVPVSSPARLGLRRHGGAAGRRGCLQRSCAQQAWARALALAAAPRMPLRAVPCWRPVGTLCTRPTLPPRCPPCLPHPQPYGKLVTMIHLKVSLSDFLTLFAARTESFFFTMRPGEWATPCQHDPARRGVDDAPSRFCNEGLWHRRAGPACLPDCPDWLPACRAPPRLPRRRRRAPPPLFPVPSCLPALQASC